MLLVADGGSTKADWICIDAKKNHVPYKTQGFNPFYHDLSKIVEKISFLDSPLRTSVDAIYYYGAGCSDVKRCAVVADAMREVFPSAAFVEITHDLLGAARAVCHDSAGIACILGTGSNSCLFDGREIKDNIENLGYLAGDEGSGSHIGRNLLQAYFYRELPKEICNDFEAKYPQGKRALLDELYSPKGSPNVFLASFAPFVQKYAQHPYIIELLEVVFDTFIKRHPAKYADSQKLPIHFVGSVAHAFAPILKNVVKKNNMILGQIIKKPIEALAHYHAQKFFG